MNSEVVKVVPEELWRRFVRRRGRRLSDRNHCAAVMGTCLAAFIRVDRLDGAVRMVSLTDELVGEGDLFSDYTQENGNQMLNVIKAMSCYRTH